jgi:hypothetical protein
MPVSPQDFALYSRMTGTPVPMDAMSRMQMAPDVYKFTKDYAKKPNLLETTGNLVKTVGKIGAYGLGLGMQQSLANEERALKLKTDLLKSKITGDTEEPKTTAEKHDQNRVDSQTAVEQIERSSQQGSQLADSDNIAEELSRAQAMTPAFDEMIGEAATGEKVESFLDQFKDKDKDSPGLDRALMGLLDQNKEKEELVGEGIVGPSTSIPFVRYPFDDHVDMESDGGENDANIAGAENFKPVFMETPEVQEKPSVSERGDKFLEDLTKQAQKDLGDPDAMMDKPSFSYPTTRAGRQEVGITEGGDIYQIFKKDPQKTYITRATPRQAEMFQEMLPDYLTEDRKKTPGAGGFLTAFTNKTFDF